MSELNNYDATTERIEDDTSFAEKYIKYAKIFNLLNANGIEIAEIGGHTVNVEDKSCGFTLCHAITSWQIFRVVDVVDMIVGARDNYLKRKDNGN